MRVAALFWKAWRWPCVPSQHWLVWPTRELWCGVAAHELTTPVFDLQAEAGDDKLGAVIDDHANAAPVRQL